ncbi:MauE/DoxX family redox-associated membrane protein [Corynebacterium sp.]|uniref:MauE/DoxX family redox-associated membrane protein n=1 Tax=Corynebacterium sp. TaxID=1720 RepID=UPI0026DD9F0E|nr:MauE/DoxX family redox-associated membrane protein [Corynebacterium sp.]MDO4611013.1 MauE/DoxX family redox-associated membrane protein [Corynebacterium sp.]
MNAPLPDDARAEAASATVSGGRGRAVVSAVARFGLAVVWLWSGGVKLAHPLDAAQAIAAYEIVPAGLVEPLSVALPAVELVLGLMLLLGVFLRPAALVSGIIMAGFIIGLASAWARGLTIDCGCFGGGGQNPDADALTYLKSLSRDVVFLLLAAVVWFRPLRRWAVRP